jgi:hypothetical protein
MLASCSDEDALSDHSNVLSSHSVAFAVDEDDEESLHFGHFEEQIGHLGHSLHIEHIGHLGGSLHLGHFGQIGHFGGAGQVCVSLAASTRSRAALARSSATSAHTSSRAIWITLGSLDTRRRSCARHLCSQSA